VTLSTRHKKSPAANPPSRARRIRRWGLLGIVAVAAGGGVFAWTALRDDPAEAAKQSNALADTAKQGANEFIRCVAADEPGLDLWRKSDIFVKDMIAKHYTGLGDRMRDRCIPSLGKLRGSLKKDRRVPERVGVALDQYKTALASLETTTTQFAEKTAARDNEERTFHGIVTAATEWQAAPTAAAPTPFERFMVCAVPGIEAMPDGEKLFRFFADTCVHGDPMGFMTKTQRNCGALLSGGAAGAAGGNQDPLVVRRFHTAPKDFMKFLWTGCTKDAYKVWIAADGGGDLLESLTKLREAGTRLAAEALKSPT